MKLFSDITKESLAESSAFVGGVLMFMVVFVFSLFCIVMTIRDFM